jgi:WD40 repeat protein
VASAQAAIPQNSVEDTSFSRTEVEPALLSVVCRELNNRRIQAGQPQLTTELIDSGAQQQIIAEFYERSFEGLAPSVREWVEDNLLTSGGYRDSEAVEDAERHPGVTRAGIDELVARRLLRLEDRSGVLRVELTHDVLTGVTRASRDHRVQTLAGERVMVAERARRKRFRLMVAGSTAAALAAVGLSIVFAVLLQRARHEQVRLLETQGLMLLTQANVGIERGIPGDPGANLGQALRTAPGQATIVARAVTLLSQREQPRLALQETARTLLGVPPAGFVWRGPGTLEVYSASDAVRLDTKTTRTQQLEFRSTGDDDEHWGGLQIGFGLPATGLLAPDQDPGKDKDKSGPPRRKIIAYDPRLQVAVWRGTEGRQVVYDLAEGRVLARPLRLTADAAPLQLSADRRWLAHVDAQQTVQVVAPDGQASRTIAAPAGLTWRPTAVAAAAAALLLQGGDGSWHWAVWRNGSYRTVALGAFMVAPRLRSDGQSVLVVREAQVMRLQLDAQGLLRSHPVLRHALPVLAMDLSSDEKRVVTGSLDRTARVAEIDAGVGVGVPMRHEGAVVAVRFVGDGLFVATGSRDGTARVWRAGADKPAIEPAMHGSSVVDIAVDPKVQEMATLGADGSIALWQLQLKPPGQLIRLEAAINALAVSPDGTHVAAALDNGQVLMWALERSQPGLARERWRDTSRPSAGLVLAFNAAGSELAVGRQDGSVQRVQVNGGAATELALTHRNAVRSLGYSPDGALLAIATSNRSAQLWELAGNRQHALAMPQQGDVTQLQFSPDGKRLATVESPSAAGSVWAVRVWDTATTIEQTPAHLMAAGQRVGKIAWHAADTQPLVIGGSWHGTSPWSGAQSPDGALLFGGGTDGTGVLVQAATGLRLGAPMRHDNTVLAAEFSADGQWLVTRAADRVARVWHARSGVMVADPVPIDPELPALLALSGRVLVSAADASTLRLLELGLDFPLPEPPWLKDLVELGAGAQPDAFGGVRPVVDRLPRLRELRARGLAAPEAWWTSWGRETIDRLVTPAQQATEPKPANR